MLLIFSDGKIYFLLMKITENLIKPNKNAQLVAGFNALLILKQLLPNVPLF